MLADKQKPQKSKSHKTKEADLLFEAIAEVCRIDWKICTGKQRAEVNQTTGILRKLNKSPDEVRFVSAWWLVHDWRGKQGQAPTPSQLREVWGQAFSAEPPKARQKAPTSTLSDEEREVARQRRLQRDAKLTQQGVS